MNQNYSNQILNLFSNQSDFGFIQIKNLIWNYRIDFEPIFTGVESNIFTDWFRIIENRLTYQNYYFILKRLYLKLKYVFLFQLLAPVSQAEIKVPLPIAITTDYIQAKTSVTGIGLDKVKIYVFKNIMEGHLFVIILVLLFLI